MALLLSPPTGLCRTKESSLPPPLLYDLSHVDLDRVVITQEEIYQALPQRHEFIQLHGIIHTDRDAGVVVAYRDISADEWWAKAHVPGAPVFPGVLMLETAAQLAAFWTSYYADFSGFVAFGGVDKCKFRDAVIPPARIVIISKMVEARPRRIAADCQALMNDRLIFEARITGLPLAGGPPK
jgi:3-hydroxyacyl-[acyl-carrier-protein] dehydratase